MRVFVLLLLASCSHGWLQSSVPDPEPDPKTTYSDVPIAAPHQPSRVAYARACEKMKHPFGVVVWSFADEPYNLCASVDGALGRLPELTGFNDLVLSVEMLKYELVGSTLVCDITMTVGVRGGDVLHKFNDVRRTQLGDNCVDGLVDKLVRDRAYPAMRAARPLP